MTDPNLARARGWIEQALPRVKTEVRLRIQDWEPLVSACAHALVAAVKAKGAEMRDVACLAFPGRMVDDMNKCMADVPPPPVTP